MRRSPSRNPPPASPDRADGTLPDTAGEVLLPIARAAIAVEFDIRIDVDDGAHWLHEEGACFVTLTTHGELSGCIGSVEAHRTLLADVRDNARGAAFRDRRFPALTAAELDHSHIEVSVLSPTAPMTYVDEEDALAQLRPHVDGVVFECGRHRSTLLPQVWQRVADPAEFLAILKRKAGLPATFRSDHIHLSRYTVTEYHEGR